MKVLFFVICFSVVQQAWFLGTPPSKLEAKCEAYPSLSHYHKDICYIVDKRSKCLKKDAKDSLCTHLHFFNGQIAKYDEKVEFELKTVGLLKDGYPAFFKDRIFQGEDNNKTNGPVVCAYTDDFYCPEGYQLLGVHCYKIFTDASLYADAEKACEKDHGSLAVVHTDRTVQFLATLAHTAKVSNEKGNNLFYIGLAGDKKGAFKNADHTNVDYFRWVPIRNGVGTNGKAVIEKLEKPAAVISAAVTNADKLATFGYMDVRCGTKDKLPFACQVAAKHHYGQVVIPYSSLEDKPAKK
jgi:hypothetical protein